MAQTKQEEKCQLCGCQVHRSGEYAKPTVKGRSHACEHHYVAKRFSDSDRVFGQYKCPWQNVEGQFGLFCYECGEEFLHNPVLLPEDVSRFAELIQRRGLHEDQKEPKPLKYAGRIKLFREVIDAGLRALLKENTSQVAEPCPYPGCQHVFKKGKGFTGIDAHWKAKHGGEEAYREAWPLITKGAYPEKD